MCIYVRVNMCAYVNGWMDGCIDGWVDRWKSCWTIGWVDGLVSGGESRMFGRWGEVAPHRPKLSVREASSSHICKQLP